MVLMPTKKSTEPTITRRSLADYSEDLANANKGSERGLSMVEESLNQDGAGRSIVVDGAGRIVAGNKTFEAAALAGIEDVIEVETDGHALIVHRRRDWDLTDVQGSARRYAYRDNRASEVSLTWSAEQLLADVNAGFDFEHLFSAGELAELLADVNAPDVGDDPGAQVDRAGELQQQWNTSLGQLWTIGRHRLLCGDSTNADDVATLMAGERADAVVTDPPYGMRLDTDNSNRKSGLKGAAPQSYSPVIGDEHDYDPNHLFRDFGYCREIFLWGADYYAQRVPELSKGSWIVWDKRLDENLDGRIGSNFELCWSKTPHQRLICRVRWLGAMGTETQDIQKRFHPTQKPIEAIEFILTHWTESNWLIVDVFGGSGTTMVACEQLGRQCRMMELEPKYCAVILERMAGMGLTPELQAE